MAVEGEGGGGADIGNEEYAAEEFLANSALVDQIGDPQRQRNTNGCIERIQEGGPVGAISVFIAVKNIRGFI